MTMTVTELRRELERIEEDGGGEKPVKIDPPFHDLHGVYERHHSIELSH